MQTGYDSSMRPSFSLVQYHLIYCQGVFYETNDFFATKSTDFFILYGVESDLYR